MSAFIRELLAGAAASPSGVATAVLTLTATADPGDRVVLFFASKPTSGTLTGTAAVTDSRGNTWTIDAGPQGAANNWCIIASTLQNKARLQVGDTVTVTMTGDTFGTGSTMLYYAGDFSGLDVPDVAATNNNASGLVATTGTTAATAQDHDEIAVAGVMWGTTETSITPSSFTPFPTGMVTGPSRSGLAAYTVLSAVGAQSETFTGVGGSDFSIAAIATYRSRTDPTAAPTRMPLGV